MTQGAYIERALFMIGNPNTGKSTQLRSMFLDWRLGNKGKIPTGNRVSETYPLGNERWLYLRLTSPHESKITLEKFLDNCGNKMTAKANEPARRWNFAGALQYTQANIIDDAATVIEAFVQRFEPERVRAVFLSPDRHGIHMPQNVYGDVLKDLRRIRGVEIITTDATSRLGNGGIYSGFFDFT